MAKKTFKNKPDDWRKPALFWGAVVVVCLAVALVAAMVRSLVIGQIDSFDKCKTAGGSIAESYPEQCFINGKSFINPSQVSSVNDYVGMSEQAALDKAVSAGTPARVVERDGESLPVTMDYMVGRHNFHVRDGRVYEVGVEGSER